MLEVIPCIVITMIAARRLYHQPRMFDRAISRGGPGSPGQVSATGSECQWASPSSRSSLEKTHSQTPSGSSNEAYAAFSPGRTHSGTLTPASTIKLNPDPAESTDTSIPIVNVIPSSIEGPTFPHLPVPRNKIDVSKLSMWKEARKSSRSVDSTLSQAISGQPSQEAVEMKTFEQPAEVMSPQLLRMGEISLSTHSIASSNF
jgi:hypothetical protein